MIEANSNTTIYYTATEGQTSFALTFPYASESDIKCYITNASGVYEQTTAFTIDATGTTPYLVMNNGLTAGTGVKIQRDTAITQETQYRNQGATDLREFEKNFDKLTMIAQEQRNIDDAKTLQIGTVQGGTTADASITGTAPNLVLNLTLPKGDKGDTGATGEQGEKGEQGDKGDKGDKGDTGNTGATGPSNTLSIGTVEGGATASATITGTSPNQTLNLVLPKGETGATGETGAAGADGKDGQGLAIGTVYFSQSSSASDNPGGLPLFTGETIANADEVYPDFYNWVNSHSALQISAADYATAISTYGECAKYVVDTVNKSVTLPLLKNFLKMANTTDGITEGEAGLPNITGKIGQEGGTNPDIVGGCVKIDSTDTSITQSLTAAVSGYPNKKIDASLSSSIYGNSTTVTPQHTTLYPWVFAFNVSVPASTAQAAEFQDALSGKVDLATGVAQADVDYVIETYTNGTDWYRIYKSGWCEQGGQTNIASSEGNYSLAFLQEFADTNYNFSCHPEITDMTSTGIDRLGVYRIVGAVYGKSATGIQIQYDSSTFTGKFFWRAEGYLAS